MKSITYNYIIKLLTKNVSNWQLIGYIISNIVGLSIVLIGLSIYVDSHGSQGKEDSYFSNDFIVISKKVEGLGFSPSVFSEEDLSQLKDQSWVKNIGEFSSSHFSVSASIDIAGRGLSSYLFLESVPDEFYDIQPKNWEFDENKGYVPIIINKDYLALYNYGFAVPHGLPQISEELVSLIPIKLRVSGRNGLTNTFDASIVGFSSRLNTIAVPQAFMDWANVRFGTDVQHNPPSRLIVEVDRLYDREINDYVVENNLEIAGDKETSQKITGFFGFLSAIVTAIGITICLLSIFILMLSIFLLLQKSKTALHNLMLLGYTPSQIGKCHSIAIWIINCFVAAISFIVLILLRPLWITPMHDLGIVQDSILWPTIVAILIYVITISTIDITVIKTYLMKIWRNE